VKVPLASSVPRAGSLIPCSNAPVQSSGMRTDPRRMPRTAVTQAASRMGWCCKNSPHAYMDAAAVMELPLVSQTLMSRLACIAVETFKVTRFDSWPRTATRPHEIQMEDRDADAMGTLCLEYGDSIQISYKEVPRATVESLLPKSYRLPHLDLGVYLVALPSGSTEPCSGAGASDRPDDASTAALATPASALCAIVTCSALQMFASERRHLFTAAALDDLRVSLPSDMMYRLKYFCLGQVLDAIPRHFARDMPRYAVWFLRQGLS